MLFDLIVRYIVQLGVVASPADTRRVEKRWRIGKNGIRKANQEDVKELK